MSAFVECTSNGQKAAKSGYLLQKCSENCFSCEENCVVPSIEGNFTILRLSRDSHAMSRVVTCAAFNLKGTVHPLKVISSVEGDMIVFGAI